ncbi:hypothetical protein Vafri_13268, partial [Volvox africanus]
MAMDRPPPLGGSLRATPGERLLLSASMPICISRSGQLSASSWSSSLGPYPRLASVRAAVNTTVVFRRWGHLPYGLNRPPGGAHGSSLVRLPAAAVGTLVPRLLLRQGPMGQCGGPPWSCSCRRTTHRANGARADAGGGSGGGGSATGTGTGGEEEAGEAAGSGGGAGAGASASRSGPGSSSRGVGFVSSSSMSVTDSVGGSGTDRGRDAEGPGGLRSGERKAESSSGGSASSGEVAAAAAPL